MIRSLKYKMGCRCINPCTQIQDTLWNQHEWVLERIGADEELISTLDGFTDFEAMGNFYMREDGVRRTEFGLLRKLSDPFPEVQDGLQMH